MLEHLYHPQRLNYPLKRVAEKGAGHWQQISWDQTLDEVAEKLARLCDKYGAEPLAFTHGTKRTYHWDCRKFFNLFGSPNTYGVNTICMCPSYTTEYATYGGMIMGSEVPAANCFVLWGCNASQSTPNILSPQIIRARKNRAKLIVVAPRKTREAGKADIWLQIRPGTDQALMLGWIPLIIKEQLYDQDFVSRYTVGFAELEEAVESYTPAKVAEITSIPEELVVQGARMPQEQKGKQLGADMYPFFGYPGWEKNTAANQQLPEGYMAPPEAWHSNLAHAREVMEAIITGKPYPVTAAITLANPPLLALPNTKRVFEALKKLEFNVVVEYCMTPSAAMADTSFQRPQPWKPRSFG